MFILTHLDGTMVPTSVHLFLQLAVALGRALCVRGGKNNYQAQGAPTYAIIVQGNDPRYPQDEKK